MSGEERAFGRVGDSLLVSYTIDADHRPEFTETYDIGTGGLAMLTNAELQTNRDVTITIELRGDARPALQVYGAVRWSRLDALVGKYRTGIEFRDVDETLTGELLRYIDTLRRLRDMGFL